MVMIKAFLFDYDGAVTARSTSTSPSEAMANLLQISSAAAADLFMSLWPDYLRGNITTDEFWHRIEAQTGKMVPSEQRGIWLTWEQLQPLPEMVALVKDLQAAGYSVGLLTNAIPVSAEAVRTHGGYESFDFVVASCMVGYAKPEPEIYELAMQQLPGLSPEQVVFVDDQERHLAPARSMGMHTILAHNAAQVIHDVKQLINLS
jgi:epoxide hydrolase-like predicted phosphatase